MSIVPAPIVVQSALPEPLEENLEIKLSDEERPRLVIDALEAIDRAIQDRNAVSTYSKGFDVELEEYWKRYEGVPPDRDPVWTGAANYRTPLSKWIIDGIHSRIMRTVFSVRPWVLVGPASADDVANAPKVQEFFEYSAEHELDLEGRCDELVLNTLVEGTGVAKIPWVIERDWVREEQQELDQEPLMLDEGPMLDFTGFPIMRQVQRPRIVEDYRVVYEGPRLEVVDIKDFIVPFPFVSLLKRQPWVAHRIWLTPNELARRVKDGYDEKAVEEVLKVAPTSPSYDTRASLHTVKDQIEGVQYTAPVAGLTGKSQGVYEVFELVWPWDVNKDDIDEKIVLTIEKQSRQLLRAIKFPYWHGQYPYAVVRVKPRPNRFLGQSIVADLYHTQDENDALTNQRIDGVSALIGALFTFIYTTGSGFDPSKQKIGPGKSIQVDDLQQVQTLGEKVRTLVVPGADIQANLLAIAERIGGISDPQSGRPAEQEKTAFEIGAVISEGNIKFNQYIRRFHTGLAEIAQQAIALYSQYIDRVQGKVFRVGSDPAIFQRRTVDEIRGRFDYRPHGSTLTANKDLEARKALSLMQLAERSDIMRRIVTRQPVTDREWALVKSMFDAIEVKNAKDIIGTQEEAAQSVMAARAQMAQGGGVQQVAQAVAGQGPPGSPVPPQAPPQPATMTEELGA